MPDTYEKNLTPGQRADRLWGKLKVRAAELRHGRLSVDIIVDEGHIVGLELTGQRERMIAD